MSHSTPIRCEPLPAASLFGGQLLVAGPCSVESRHQLRATCLALAKTRKVSMLRAGIWKPRSQPGLFEGVGAEGLPWLMEVRAESGLPVAVEVARPRHVEACLEQGVDVLWLGARTTVNPFMVQEIANALKGTGVPVMIKNPVCPDLRLWTGAIERIALAGSTKLAAIHRGFLTHEQSTYRNIPLWELPMALKRDIPDLPLLCDPSHIAGHADRVLEVALIARELGVDGYMIEVHHEPGKALTDPLQQLRPSAYQDIAELLMAEGGPGQEQHRPAAEGAAAEDEVRKGHEGISGRKNARKPADAGQETPRQGAGEDKPPLDTLRREIDRCDHQILDVLAMRLSLSEEVGRQKKTFGEDIIQPQRQQDLLRDRLKKAKELGLDATFVEKFLVLLHEESVAIQRKTLDP